MAELKYEGNTVNSVVSQLTSIAGKFDPLANTVKSCTGVMVGRRGFNLVGGGVTSDSISQSVGSCSESLGELVKDIRTKQVAILTYSQDEDAINAFVKSLSRLEYDALDLSGIENKISGWTKLSFAAKGVFASVGTFAAGFLEGGANFIETVADTGAILVTGAASIFTKPYDLINGTNVTDEMWESTKAYVAEEQVASIADKFYANTEAGQFLKENAYGFDMVRGVGRGVGYSTAMIAAGNVFAGAGGLTGAAKAARLGKVLPAMSGVLGFGNSSEEGWADGASTEKGLMYGVAGGTWEAIQWGVGVKINGMGSHIDDIAQVGAKQVFKDSAKRVILDTVDSGVEGFVQPGLTMIYKQYEGDTLAAQYANAFETNGGWNGVIQQAAIGGFMSGSSEIGDVFKYNRNLVKTSKAGSTKKADATKTAVVDQKADTVLKGKPGYGENGMPLLNVKPGDDVTVRTEVTYDKTPTSGDVRVRETYAENGMPILDVKPRSDANIKPQTTVSPKTTKGFEARPAKAASTVTGDTKISTGASARTTASTKPQVYVDSRMPKFDRNSLDAALSSVSSKPQVDPNVTYAKNGMPVFELDNIGHSAIASNAVNLGSRSAGVDLATGLDVGDFSFDTGNITQASAGVASLAGLGKMGFDLSSSSMGSDFDFDVRLKSEMDMRNALDDVKNFGTKTPKFNDSISGKKAPDVRTKGTDVRTKGGSSSTTSSRVTSRAQAEADMKNSLRDLDKVKTKTTESKPLPTRRKDFDQIGKKSVTDRNIRDFELMENSRTKMTPLSNTGLDGVINRQRVEADGSRVINNYNSDGKLISKYIIKPDGTHEVMLPKGDGHKFETINVIKRSRPVENISFDSKGNAITERFFDDGTYYRAVNEDSGRAIETVHNSKGNIIRQTEVRPDGSYREVTYDNSGNVISNRSSGSNFASDYDSTPMTPSQRVVEDIPNLDGNVSRQRVEADGTRVIDNYDADGNLMSKHVIHSDGTHEVMLPLGEGNRFDTIKLDEQNRPLENVSFDSKGNVITERYFEDGTCHRFVSDETGKNFETVYDSNGNLIRQTEVGADGSYREIKYDDTGKVISDRSSGSNQASDYGSSPMGSTAKAAAAGVPLTKGVENIVSRPDGSTSSYKVEADGRVIESDYNYRGELIGRRETLPDGSLIEYKTFDKGTLTTSFDKMGNITKAVETNVDGTVKTTRFDGKGNYDKMTVDSSGRLIEKQWNVDGNTNIHKFNHPDGSSSLRIEGKDGSLHIKDFRTDGSIRERIYNTDKTTEARVTNPDKSTRVTKFDTNKRMYERIETTRDGVVTTSKFKTDGTTIVKTDYLDRHSIETVYNSNNQMISSHEINPNGTYVNKKYDVSGKVIEKISSTETGSIYIERYNSDSTYTKRVIESGNDVISETTFDQRGKVVKESLEYKDGSMFEKKYNSDGTTEIKTVNADKTYDIKKIDSNGKILEQTWTSKDGTTRRQITNSDGTYSRHTEDADGRVRDSVLNKNKIMTSQTEVRPDGSKQYFVRNADGSTNITEYRADGSIRAVDNRPDGTYNKVIYDKNGRIVEQSWSDTNGTISTQKTNSDGTYSRHVVENNGTYRDLVIDKNNRLVSKVEHRTDGTVITTNRRADGGMVVEEKYKTGASMKNTYDRNNNLVEQVYRNTDGSITRKVFNAPTPNDGRRVQPQQRPQPQQVQKSQPVQMPVYRNADEVIRGLSNPLNEANLERIVRRINDGRTGSTYNKIVSVNTTTPKILPTQSAVDSFYKKFASGDYLFHDQRPYFDHFRSWDFDSKVEVTDRLYLNMKDFSDTYKFCELFATECDKRGIPFYLKTATALGGKADIHPKQLMRDESIVIYSGKNYLSDYTNIASEIVAKYGFKLEEPPVLTGRLKNNIGYGAEPLSFNGRCSFNSLRSNIIDAAINKLNANYRQRGLPLYSGNYYTELKNLIIEFGRQCGIDASNFCNNIK